MEPNQSRAADKAHILVIEDEADIAQFIATELRFEGHEVTIAPDGMKGLMSARAQVPDLVILDRMLPGLDGLEVCRRLRQTTDVPILMLTAKGEVKERVEGLHAGANDYLPKPFDLEELLARVNVQLRSRNSVTRTRFQVADLVLDTSSREVQRGETNITLSPKEFDLLSFLIQHPRQVLTREQILEAVWGYDFEGEDNILEVYVRYVRNKIEREGQPKLLHTVRGVGYVLKEGS